MPKIFHEKTDKTLGHQTPVWLNDIIVVTRGTKEEHNQNLYSVHTKLEYEGYGASKRNKGFTKKETIWLGRTEGRNTDLNNIKQELTTLP